MSCIYTHVNGHKIIYTLTQVHIYIVTQVHGYVNIHLRIHYMLTQVHGHVDIHLHIRALYVYRNFHKYKYIYI